MGFSASWFAVQGVLRDEMLTALDVIFEELRRAEGDVGSGRPGFLARLFGAR